MTAPVEYVMARSALIDALIALRDHSSTIILIGAQAVYEWTGEGELAVAVMTTGRPSPRCQQARPHT